MRPGDVQTPALTLSVANDQGSLSSLEVAPVPVSVTSVLVEGDTTLREIKPQAELVSEAPALLAADDCRYAWRSGSDGLRRSADGAIAS